MLSTAITSAAFLVTGTALGFSAMKKEGEFDAEPSAATADRGERLSLAADVCLGAAAVSAVTSIILFFRTDGGAEEPAVTITPTASPSGGGVHARLRF